MIHNRYRQRGGEDAVARSEAIMLRARGIDVLEADFDNDVPKEAGFQGAVQLAMNSAWSNDSYHKVLKICQEYRPDIAHVHNFWMKLTPSVHSACHEAGVPTVQTLHNFRLFCVNALLKRGGTVCEDCLGKVPWRGVLRRCYRSSFVASAAVARMIMENRARGTWEHEVDAFVALSEHSKSKFIAGGLPADRIFVKPNFVEDMGGICVAPSESNLVLFVGRLSDEKGVKTLISAWSDGSLARLGRLVIAGDGPERQALERQAASAGLSAPNVVFAGLTSTEEVMSFMRSARVVVLPSLFFECFPRTLAEAFSCGRPVAISNVGALSEIVGLDTGLNFEASNPVLLRETLHRMLTDNSLVDRLGQAARAEYLARYTPDRNFQMLMGVYRAAIERRSTALPHELLELEAASAS